MVVEDTRQKAENGGQKSEHKKQHGDFFYRVSLWLVPLLFRLLSFFLFATCRVERRGLENFQKFARHKTPFIVSFWHYGVIYTVYQARSLPYVAMVSASKDGEYVSRILQSKGFCTVRGSRNKGALGALKGLIREMKKGKTAVLVADGSQGPARKAQSGSILLASKTGAAIVPTGWAASRYKTFRSWDRTALPMPFAKVVIYYGKPLVVPARVKGDEVEHYRLQLEESLDDLYKKSWAQFGRTEH